MLFNLFLGGLVVACLFLLIDYAKKHSLLVPWWKWLLTVLGLVFAVFTIEVIAGFLQENAAQAALVVGMILLIITIIWGVLIFRYVFKRTA